MRILHVTTELMPGGAERVVVELCRGQLAAGHSVATCALKPVNAGSPVLAELRTLGVPVSSLDLAAFTPWRVWRLRGTLRAFDPDIVHSHLFHAQMVARLNAGGPRRWKLVDTVHVCERRKGQGWRLVLTRATQRRCDALTAVSGAVRDFTVEHCGIERASIHLVPNGIEEIKEPDASATARLRAEWGATGGAKVIGMVGRLDRQKGFDRVLGLLSALARAVPAGQRLVVVILGEGPDRAALEKLAATFLVKGSDIAGSVPAVAVVLPGFREDAADCIGAFDVFLMPSRFEGFGLVLAEAMAHGLPVLASDADSLPELLAGYENGRVVDFRTGDAEVIAGEILRAVGEAGRTPHFPYTLERMLAGYSALYEELLHPGVSSAGRNRHDVEG